MLRKKSDFSNMDIEVNTTIAGLAFLKLSTFLFYKVKLFQHFKWSEASVFIYIRRRKALHIHGSLFVRKNHESKFGNA